MRIGRLLAFVFSALAFLCAPLVAQTIVTNVNALRAGTVTAGTTVLLAGYVNAQDGGGGMLYSITGSCGYTNYANSVAGKVVTVPNTFNFTKIALNMLFTGVGVANDPVTAFDANALTITLLTAPTMSMGSFSLNGDNGGTIFVTSSGVCWYRASQTYSQAEWGAGTGYTTSYITDDTTLLQNWINAQQPHIAVPGTSVISSPLTCVGTAGTFSGPPRSGTTEINGPVPLFQIVSATGFTGSAMLEMDPGGTTGGCAIHNVGLIADGTGNFDTVDAYGQADLVDGSYIYGGKVNFHCIGAGEDVEIFDSFLSESYFDNIDSVCPNFRVIRNVIAQAGTLGSSGTAGKNIYYTGSDAIIANNTIETATGDGVDLNGAQKVRFANNYVDRNGTGVAGAAGLRNNGSNHVTVCNNVFSYTGAATVPAAVAHIYLSGAIDDMKICGNSYFTDNGDEQAIMRPNYDYDASPTAVLTNVDISEKAAPADSAVFSPAAIAQGLPSMVSPHIWQNYINGFGLTDASSGGTPVLAIAPGDAPDTSNSFPITLPPPSSGTAACTINFGTVGAGGLDAGVATGNGKYYVYVISGPGGADPNCIASTQPPSGGGPSFVSAGPNYQITTNATTTAGSAILTNVGQNVLGPHGDNTQANGWPTKGMAIGNLVADAGGAVGTITSLKSFEFQETGCTVMPSSPYVTNCPTPLTSSGATPLMAFSATQYGLNLFPGSTNTAPVYVSDFTSCGSSYCFTASQSSKSTSSTTAAIVSIGGNLTITLNTPFSGTHSSHVIYVYDGYYRLVGTAILNAGATDFAGISTVQNLTGVSASVSGALAAGACNTATVKVPGATTSQKVVTSPVTYPGMGFTWDAHVDSADTVKVYECAIVAGTPIATPFSVSVLQYGRDPSGRCRPRRNIAMMPE